MKFEIKNRWSGSVIFETESFSLKAAVKKAVAADPKAVGYIEKAALDGSVKAVLTLD